MKGSPFSKKPFYILFAVLIVGACTSLSRMTQSSSLVDAKAREAMVKLADTKNGCPREFDYFPDGGIRIFYCHLKQVIDYREARKLLPIEIFRSGPHGEELDLDNPHEFGHYNPEFVQLMVDYGIPAASSDDFRRATQSIYRSYVQSLARTMYVTYRKFQESPDLLAKEKEKLQTLLGSENGVPGGYYEKYYYFMNPAFADHSDGEFDYFYEHGMDAGFNGNVVKTAAFFWIRRSIDGTDAIFYAGLRKLLATYDREYLD